MWHEVKRSLSFQTWEKMHQAHVKVLLYWKKATKVWKHAVRASTSVTFLKSPAAMASIMSFEASFMRRSLAFDWGDFKRRGCKVA
jgi:hypothetical protein